MPCSRLRHRAGHSFSERRLARRIHDALAGEAPDPAGINFLVPCGTTGESPTLTRKEHLRVVEITLEEAKGRVPVLAGAGGYNTAEVIELANELKAIGADGILSVTPYYNKPTQEGLYQHYKAIARRGETADDRVQRAGAHGRERRARHAEAPLGNR